METQARHALIGTFTLAVLALAVVFVVWLGKLRLNREWDEYDVVFTESVAGLSSGGAVEYSGIQVGDVRKLSLHPRDPKQVIARIRVNAGTPVKVDTKAKLAVTGITGLAVIHLFGGTEAAPVLTAKKGQEVPRIIAEESSLQKLLVSSEEVLANAQDVLARLSAALSDDNLDKISATLDHVEKITRTVADHDEEIGVAIKELAVASKSLRRTIASTDKLVARMDKLAGSADQVLTGETKHTLESARLLAESATSLIEENRQALTTFSNDDLAKVGSALRDLRAAVRALRELSDLLKEDPQSLLRGKKETPREHVPQ